jgi:hypothetical protein
LFATHDTALHLQCAIFGMRHGQQCKLDAVKARILLVCRAAIGSSNTIAENTQY